MASTAIAKLIETISNFMTGNKITLTNLVVTLVTAALNVLLDDDIFDCPQKDFKAYGYMFLIFPCVILLFANMMVIVTDWNPLNLLTVPLKGNLPPLVSLLARRVSFLSRRVSFLSRRVSFLSRRVSFLSRRVSSFH